MIRMIHLLLLPFYSECHYKLTTATKILCLLSWSERYCHFISCCLDLWILLSETFNYFFFPVRIYINVRAHVCKYSKK